uniref:Uncharacterized protein n=1 Tax=Cucumis melo TaxID=3656 RepID=A0A9I9CC58_CUCME
VRNPYSSSRCEGTRSFRYRRGSKNLRKARRSRRKEFASPYPY